MIKVSGLTFLLIIEFIVVLVGLGIFSFLKNKKLSKRSETQNKDNPKKHKEDAQMKTEETSNKAKEAPTAANTGAQAKTEATTGTTEKNDEINTDAPLEAGGKDFTDAKMGEKPEQATEDIGSKSEKASSAAKEDIAEVKPKEAGVTIESANAKSEEEPVKTAEATAGKTEETSEATEKSNEVTIDDVLEEVGRDNAAENAEETLDIIEEIEEIPGAIDENSEVKAEGATEPAAESNDTTSSKNTEKTAEIEEVKEVLNATGESSGTEIESPSTNTGVTSIDVKDFKNLLTERETERQHLKNKVKELEDALTKKTQELNRKIEEYKSFQESEKELLAIYKELKKSSIA